VINLFRKKPKLHFWSTVSDVEKYTPIKPAVKTIPNWFRNIKPYPDNVDTDTSTGTVKQCPSFISYFKNLYTLTLWCDLKIKIDENYYEWSSPDQRFEFTAHHSSQMRDSLPEYGKDNTVMIIKAICPWRAKTSKGYMLMQLPCTYEYNPIFEAPPGFLKTSVYHQLNPQLVFKQKGTFLIKRGTPICHYLLVKEEEVDFKVYSKQEYFKIDPTYEDMVKTVFHRQLKEKLDNEGS
jgi:hypothetical protein